MNFGKDKIADHLVRYGIGTMRMFEAACPEISSTALERRLSRGARDNLYESYRLVGATKYWVATRRLLLQFSIDDARAGMAYGYQALCKNYAIAGACVLAETPKVRMTSDEFATLLPMIPASFKHRRTRYYLDKSERDLGVVRVGLFVVDMGRKIRNVVTKVRKEVERRQKGPFEQLTKERLFVVCVLTGVENKAKQIRSALKDLPVPVRVEVVPGYADIMIWKG